jgi:hypothetical protein
LKHVDLMTQGEDFYLKHSPGSERPAQGLEERRHKFVAHSNSAVRAWLISLPDIAARQASGPPQQRRCPPDPDGGLRRPSLMYIVCRH